jgi:hypothetical protein
MAVHVTLEGIHEREVPGVAKKCERVPAWPLQTDAKRTILPKRAGQTNRSRGS